MTTTLIIAPFKCAQGFTVDASPERPCVLNGWEFITETGAAHIGCHPSKLTTIEVATRPARLWKSTERRDG